MKIALASPPATSKSSNHRGPRWNTAGSSTHFTSGQASFMINYRVENLDALLAALQAEEVKIGPTLRRP
jgi:hypothetical protein